MISITATTLCHRIHKYQLSKFAVSRFLSDSHDDFKPKRRPIPEGMDDVLKLIDSQVKSNDVMIFMKGTPSAPQCGFSLQTVRILNATGVTFSSVNVLEHGAIREAIKLYSDWPTIPQVFIKGEFIGGCDIVTSMYQDGSLVSKLKEAKLITE